MSTESSGGREEHALETNVQELMRRVTPSPAIDAAARKRVLGAILAKQAERSAAAQARVIPLPRRRTSAREAAMLGVVGLAAGLLGLLMSSDAFRPTIVHENDGRGPKEVALLDGSKALLDEGARIEERGKGTVVALRGSVVFDVVHGTGLRVEAGTARMKSLGTKFLVRAGEGETEVAVARGRVELETKGGETIVAAGQRGVARGGERPEATPAPRMSHLFAFARTTEALPSEEELASPRRRGTLIARDPRWGGERPLEIRELGLDVVVEDGVARTTIDQTFFNAENRQLEGKFQLPLPQGAAISRLGMYVDGELMEAAVVDRDRGRDIYEGIVYQRRDPALLEWMSGNSFSMRVFPLPARTEKRIFLSYTQTLEHLYDTERLVVPIPPVDLPAEKVSFRVRVKGAEAADIRSPSHDISVSSDGGDRVVTFQASSYALGDDFVLSVRSPKHGEDLARSFEADGARFLSARVSPDLASARKVSPPGRWVVLYDTSGSRSMEELSTQRNFVEALVRELDDEARVSVVAIDHAARTVTPFARATDVDVRALDSAIRREGENAAGDTRLEVGLEAAAAALGSEIEPGDTIVYVGDGIPTGSDRDAEALAHAIPASVRFAGVAVGDTVDTKLLDAVANERVGLTVTVGAGESLGDRAFDFVSSLRTPCLRAVSAQVVTASGAPVSGAEAHLASARACDGERIDVVARVPADAPAPLSIRVEGRSETGETFTRTIDAGTTKGGASYLPRLWAQRQIDALLSKSPREASRAAVVDLATKYVLATPFTSLLVLENDAMYKQYDVVKREPGGWAVYDAPKKIDVRYEPRGSEPIALDSSWDLVHRLPVQIFAPDASTMGGLGLSGIGFGGGGRGLNFRTGFGTGSGRLGGSHRDGPVERKVGRKGGVDRVLRAGPTSLKSTESLPPASRDFAQRTATLREEANDFGMIGLLRADDGPVISALPLGSTSPWFFQAASSGAYPTAFTSSYDARFDDLTELAPALLLSPLDSLREALGAPKPGAASLSEEASVALTRARRGMLGKRFRVEGTSASARLAVGREGDVTWEDGSSGDVTVYDGTVMTSIYGELDLAVRRRVGAAAPWLLATDAPFLAPAPESLAGLDVRLRPDGAVRIGAPKTPASAEEEGAPFEDVELAFDATGRVISVKWLADGAARIATLAYGADGSIVASWPDGSETRYLPDETLPAPPPAASTVVEVPVATPSRLDERLKVSPVGSEAFVVANREKLAACAALADDSCGREAAAALLGARGSLTAGELVLASHALGRLSESDRKKALGSLPEASPLRKLLKANLEVDATARRAAYRKLDLSPGRLAAWSTYRSILMDLEDGSSPSEKTRARTLTFAKSPHARADMRFLLVRTVAERVRWEDQKAALKMWEALSSDPDLGFLADRYRALIDPWGQPEASAALLIRAFDASLARGVAPTVDWQMRDIVRRGRGDIGLRLFWARWRDHLVRRGSARQILAYVETLARGIRPDDSGAPLVFDDLEPLLDRFERSGGAGAEQRIALAQGLLVLDRASDAERVLSPLVSDESPAPEALDLASVLAERLGRFADASSLLERAVTLSADVEIPIDLVRSRYKRLLSLQIKRHASSPAERTFALTSLFSTARAWRREDPDNAEVDLTVAAALDRLGMADEASRQLYSIVDRHPGDGESFAKVATALESRARFDEALGLWERASSVEPTNPTWLLQRSHLLRARGTAGDDAAARALLEQIDRGKWQDRFAPQVSEARRILAER